MKGDLRKIFAKVLKQLRKDRGLSQQALADYCNLERVYISKLERGISMPSIETVFRLAEVLEMKPQEIIELVNNQTQR